jgi:hypothetical protein
MSLHKISSNVKAIQKVTELEADDIAFILELNNLVEKMKRYSIFKDNNYSMRDVVPQNIHELVVLLTYRQKLLQEETNALLKLQKEINKK